MKQKYFFFSLFFIGFTCLSTACFVDKIIAKPTLRKIYYHCVCNDETPETYTDEFHYKMDFSNKYLHKLSTSGSIKDAFIFETWTSNCGETCGSGGNGFSAFVKTDTGYYHEGFSAFEVTVLKTDRKSVV